MYNKLEESDPPIDMISKLGKARRKKVYVFIMFLVMNVKDLMIVLRVHGGSSFILFG